MFYAIVSMYANCSKISAYPDKRRGLPPIIWLKKHGDYGWSKNGPISWPKRKLVGLRYFSVMNPALRYGVPCPILGLHAESNSKLKRAATGKDTRCLA